MLRRYVHGPSTGADTPLVWYEGPTMDQSAAHMLNTDLTGSVTSVTDFNGNPIAINRYDEYGRPQSGNMGRFQYTGQASLPEIGLYYYKARMYSPTLGRFMQTDPIGYADGVNWYNYVGGDPVNFVDPSGLFQIPKNEGIPSIVVNGRRNRSLCELSPDLCNGPVINAGLTGILNIDFDLDQIVVTATCKVIDAVLSENARLRFGGDASGGLGALFKIGLGASLRRDGSLDVDAYIGIGAGAGLMGGPGLGIDNQGGADWTPRNVNETKSEGPALVGGFGSGAFSMEGSVPLGESRPTGGGSRGPAPTGSGRRGPAGAYVGVMFETVTLTKRSAGFCE